MKERIKVFISKLWAFNIKVFNAILDAILNRIGRIALFLSEHWLITSMIITLLILAAWFYGYFMNGLYGTRFDLSSCWFGIGVITGSSFLGLGKYIIDSKYNSPNGLPPTMGIIQQVANVVRGGMQQQMQNQQMQNQQFAQNQNMNVNPMGGAGANPMANAQPITNSGTKNVPTGGTSPNGQTLR